MRCFFGFFTLYLLCLQGLAQPVVLRDSSIAYDLFSKSSMLEVRPGNVSIGSLLLHPERYRFVPTQTKLIKPNDGQKAYWFRVELTNRTKQDYFLHFDYFGTDSMVTYEVVNGVLMGQNQMGRLVAPSTDPFLKSRLIWPLLIHQGQTHTLYIYMKGINVTALYFNVRPALNLMKTIRNDEFFFGLYYGFILIITVYSLLLFVRLGDKDTILYAIWVLGVGLQLAWSRGLTDEFLGSFAPMFQQYGGLFAALVGILHILFTLTFLQIRQSFPRFYRFGLIIIGCYLIGFVSLCLTTYFGLATSEGRNLIYLFSLFDGLYSLIAGILVARRGFQPALYFITGSLLFYMAIAIFYLRANGDLAHSFWTFNSIFLGSGVEILLFTLALANKINLLKKAKDQAILEQLRLLKTNRELIETQNQVLEQQVKIRTSELHSQAETLKVTLTTLQTTQDQLIQKEKMASLGELTAGIAHEIRNPLNFVNNFSEVSTELVDELKVDVLAGRTNELVSIADELSLNLKKITRHGKRAEAIIKSMLQHARPSSGERQLTNINALAEEYLQLAYHSFQNKDNTFQSTLKTDFDPQLPQLTIAPQELSRVLLNLYTNAFYAINERSKQANSNYKPMVVVRTSQSNGQIDIRISDNGIGIPESIKQKIFQPFFTTKPPGQGTGLGLSLSYDIITKGHEGTMNVISQEGDGTEFLIQLPVRSR